MIVDARNVPDGAVLACDIAVVGSGPAGISLAVQLAERGVMVTVLEAGGERYSRQEQKQFSGELVDPHIQAPLDRYRSRQFGGGSNVWGGRCAPYDPIDFEKRSWVPFSGWPIGHSALDGYYERAHEFLDIGEFCYDANKSLGSERAAPFPGMTWDRVTDTKILRWSLPTNFRTKYRPLIAQLANLRLLLHASCLELRTSVDGSRIIEALAGSRPSHRIVVRAKMFALAAGGIESARLLLVSRGSRPAGLGNEYDQVGRYFQTHLYGAVARLRYLDDPRAVRYHFEPSGDGVYVQRLLAVRPEVQRTRQVLNFCAVLHHPHFDDPSHGSAVLSSMFFVKSLIGRRLPPELIGKAIDQKHGGMLPGDVEPRLIRQHLWNLARDFETMPAFCWDWLTRRVVRRRKLPGIQIYSPNGDYDLLYSAEQEPNPDSRVTLSHGLDSFGYNRVKSAWRYTEGDIRSIVENHAIIVDDVRRASNPCIATDVDFATLAERVKAEAHLGSHHIGLARMAEDPRAGVVDRNCRVHAVSNLYVASSAVFPTSSCMSVTLLIVALALRIADTMIDELRRH